MTFNWLIDFYWSSCFRMRNIGNYSPCRHKNHVLQFYNRFYFLERNAHTSCPYLCFVDSYSITTVYCQCLDVEQFNSFTNINNSVMERLSLISFVIVDAIDFVALQSACVKRTKSKWMKATYGLVHCEAYLSKGHCNHGVNYH